MDTSKIDLISLVGVPLKKTAQTNGGEFHGPCPFCGGDDRFWVVPSAGRWYCRHCNERGGDAIAFIQQRDNCDFKTALAVLGLEAEKDYSRPKSPPPAPRVKDTNRDKPANNLGWQECANDFMVQSAIDLKKSDYAMRYLKSRGLSDWLIDVSWLGYNPSGYESSWAGIKVYMPQGIVIPWQIGEQITAIRLRKQGVKPGEQKYAQAAGMVQSLYYPVHYKAHPHTPKTIAILCEGEFDALSIQEALYQAGIYHVHPCALGSVTNGRTMANVLALTQAKRVLLALDDDQAGNDGCAWWLSNLPNAARLKPLKHDPNDMLVQLGWESIMDWLEAGIYG